MGSQIVGLWGEPQSGPGDRLLSLKQRKRPWVASSDALLSTIHRIISLCHTKKTEDRNNLIIGLKVIWEMKH